MGGRQSSKNATKMDEIFTLLTCRSRGFHGQILAQQLTIYQPGGADYMLTTLLPSLPDFQTFLRPCLGLTLSSKRQI